MAIPRRRGTQVRKGPETKELYGGWCQGGYEIKLADIPAWRLAALEPVPETAVQASFFTGSRIATHST
ncbi:hypothetical protein AB0E82_14220 [Streptomyces anulatus]|uniref:hypothetical protein n=1 Tax=Streptomyces anulatus TaxID=1892 RepID=UPI0033F4BD8B